MRHDSNFDTKNSILGDLLWTLLHQELLLVALCRRLGLNFRDLTAVSLAPGDKDG